MDLSWLTGGSWSYPDEEPPPVAATRERPPMANLPSQLYPEHNVKWYPNAAEEDHSTWKETGFKPPDRPKKHSPVQAVEAPAPALPQGDLEVTVAAALVLPEALDPSGEDAGPGWYSVTAYYPSEDLPSQESRRTQPLQSTRPRPRGKEECTLNQRIRVPFNTREQFLRVALYRCQDYQPGSSCSIDNITLIAEATVPIADPTASETSMWPLVRDFEQRGGLLLSVSMPGSGSAESPPAREPAQPAAGPASPAPPPPQEEQLREPEEHQQPQLRTCTTDFLPQPQIHRHGEPTTAGPHAAAQGRLPSTASEQPPPNDAVATAVSGCSSGRSSGRSNGRRHTFAGECGLDVGSEVEVFSKTACKWQRGRVVEIEDYVLTAEYEVIAGGETVTRRRIFDLGASNVHESLRIPGLQKAALKEPARALSPRPTAAAHAEPRILVTSLGPGSTPPKNSEATQFTGLASSLAARLSPWSACMSSSPEEAQSCMFSERPKDPQEVVLAQVPVLLPDGPVLPQMWGERTPPPARHVT